MNESPIRLGVPCPFMGTDDGSSAWCSKECGLYYYESDAVQGCSIRMIAYYLNWIGILVRDIATRGQE